MNKRKVLGFDKGDIVFLRAKWGPQAGTVDERQAYKITKIGPKECTLVRVNKQTLIEDTRWGHVVRLDNQPQPGSGQINGFYPWRWVQYLVKLGNEGWDADQNY